MRNAIARASVLAVVALSLSVSPAAAQIAQIWDGSASTDWFNGNNWDSTIVPAAGDSATVNIITPNAPIIDGTAVGYSAVDLFGLNVGLSATGSLTINNGASVTITNNNLVIGGDLAGTFAGANGTVVLDGSTLSVTGTPPTSGTIFVGASGTGSFIAQNGANVDTVDSYVGHLTGATGTATVDNSTWLNNGSNYVGNRGTGTFNVLNGGTVLVGGDTYVGSDTGGNGTININGLGSNWGALGFTYLGGNPLTPTGGTGTINVLNGGTYFATADMFIGIAPGSVGNFNLTDGTVTQDGNVFLGISTGSIGTVTISGSTSAWSGCACAEMTIGGNTGGIAGGTGTVNVLNGGLLDLEGALYLGRDDGTGTANGTLNISGAGSTTAVTTAGDSLFVGYTGTGAVNITNGGQLNTFGFAYVGFYAGSTGAVIIDGAGSTWTSLSPVTVIGGNTAGADPGGNGTVTVRNGGTWNTSDVAIGFDSTGVASGTVNVDGLGSTWTADDVFVGYSATGVLNITNQATVNVFGSLSIGECFCGNGTVNVSGGSTLNVGSDLYVGNEGTGVMTVSGSGTSVIVGGNLLVGFDAGASGTLTVQNGATVSVADSMALGLDPAASGIVNVTGAGSSLSAVNGVFMGTGGELNVLNGGQVTISAGGILSDGRITVGAGSVVNATSYSPSGTATTTIGISGATSGRIDLGGGIALLAGQLVVTGRNTNATTYTLVHSGNLGGSTFDTVTYASPLVNPLLTYTPAGDVVLSVGAFVLGSVVPANASVNQRNVALAIDNAVANGATLPAGFADLFNLSGNALLNGLTAISGEIGTTPLQSAFTSSNQFMNLLSGLGGSGQGGSVVGTSYAAEKKVDPRVSQAYAAVTPRDRREADFASRWGMWASPYGGTATVQGNATLGSGDSTSRVFGVAAGAEYRFSPDTVAGFALGGAGASFGAQGGSGRADVFQAGVYVRHQAGAGYVSSVLAYGWHGMTTDRIVTIAGTDRLEADFSAHTLAARLEGGYHVPMGWGRLTPYAALQTTTFFLPSYGERATAGSNQFALSYSSQTQTNLRTELGARAEKTMAMAEGILTLSGRAAWAHDTNTDWRANAAFQTVPGAAFTVNGAQPDPDGVLLSAGAEMKWLNGWSLGGTVDGEFSGTTASYTGRATLKYVW